MSDTTKILRRLAELYANPTKTVTYDQAVELCYQKLEARFDEYDKAFKDYYTKDVLTAIAKCWRFDSDKSRPKLAKIEAFLNSEDKIEKIENSKKADVSYRIAEYDPMMLMQRDIKLKRNRHMWSVYNKAVHYISEDMLLEEIPSNQWRKLDFSERCRLAWEKGLFNRLDEALVLMCRKYWDKDYQYPSAAELESRQINLPRMKTDMKALASHYRTDEARQARNDNSLDLESVFGF